MMQEPAAQKNRTSPSLAVKQPAQHCLELTGESFGGVDSRVCVPQGPKCSVHEQRQHNTSAANLAAEK